MIHSEERIMVWGGYNHFFPPPRLSSQLMRLRTRSKNLFFLSGLFLMYWIDSAVCLVRPLWSLIPRWWWLAGWSLCKCSGYGCSCGSSEGLPVPGPFHLGRWTWGHSKVIIVPTLLLTSVFPPDGVALWKAMCFVGMEGYPHPLAPSSLLSRWEMCVQDWTSSSIPQERLFQEKSAKLQRLFLLKASSVTKIDKVPVSFSLFTLMMLPKTCGILS